jgi:riboflavin synthase
MFTGLIEQVGTLGRLTRSDNGSVIEINGAHWAEPLVAGESVAVSGACLTVTRMWNDGFACDVLGETLNVTSIGKRSPGALLNLERALRMGDRLGGHFVTGHIDCIGTIISVKQPGRDYVLQISVPEESAKYIVHKGSIALEGISLTIASIQKESVEVHIIPTTWDKTNLKSLKAGDVVNIETDLLGKIIQRHLQDYGSADTGITTAKLIETGFL